MDNKNRSFVIKFLETLGFLQDTTSKNIFVKKYAKANDYEIKIKLENKIENSTIFYRPNLDTTDKSKPEPDGKILLGDLTTSNFSHPENLVVLETVNRLLDLGYKPDKIHLERKWKLGRTGKSGKADITVYNEDRETFMIIECKTWGEEFEKEKRRLFKNGGQLFSYYQQDRSTEALVLYTSTFEEGEITYDSFIIRMIDDPELVEKCRKESDNDVPCSFDEAVDVLQLVDVWKRVYNQYVFKHGLFEADASLYSLDLQPLKKKDLVPLKSSQGLFNAFAEILRHNNISDNANAFNRMLSLFLCKIVDEEEKGENDVLDFQVKLGESFEKLVDTLQKLYYKGMKEYLNVDDFVYYSDDDIKKIIKMYPERTPLERVEEMFKAIKYYTNNEFSFKEVHNKKLFYQNALILVEIIELLQNYRLKYSHKNQILGDFFELMLNHGVKQSEGQFFTPLPLVRFMVIAVGIDKFIEQKAEEIGDEVTKREPLPKIIDYACGAAHFLTEAIDEVNKVIETKQLKVREPWEERYIFGIEKDYRLARTAKIACFLNGDGSANIIFGDGLENYDELKLETKKFDFLLTNPPYSVKKFKNYLEIKHRYELIDELTQDSREIETLFVERAKQILDVDGRAAIILPSSILSNTGIYTKTRELILKNFEIVAIAEFGSQTFIATGTNVVVLFLKRRDEYFYQDRERIANEIFYNRSFFVPYVTFVFDDEHKLTQQVSEDMILKYQRKEVKPAENVVDYYFISDYVNVEKLFNSFIEYRDLPDEDYKKFVFEDEITEKLNETEIFQSYRDWFNNLTEVKKLKEQRNKLEKEIEKLKAQLEKEENDTKINRLEKRIKEKAEKLAYIADLLDNDVLFKQKVRDKEKEKFFYFSLMFKEGERFGDRRWYEFQKVVIARAPSKTEEQKQYLGYEFNKRRGFEGIEIYKDANGKPTTKLYDDADYYNPKKVVSYIRKNFEQFDIDEIDDEMKPYVSVYNLPDLFDFDRVDFEKQINLSAKKKIVINSKWELRKLGDVCEIKIGGTPKRNVQKYWGGTNLWVSVSELNGNIIYDTKEKITDEGVKNSNVKLISAGTTLLSFKLSIGKTALTGVDLYTNEAIAALLPKDKSVLDKYLFYLFKTQFIPIQVFGSKAFGQSLNSEYLAKQIKIPVPPKEIQEKIVAEIEALEKEEEENETRVNELEGEIKKIIDNIYKQSDYEKLRNIAAKIQSGGTPSRDIKEYWVNGTINWLRSEVCQDDYVYENMVKEKITELGLEKSNAKIFPKDTILVALVGATLGKVGYLTFEAATNQNIAGIYELKLISPKLLFYILKYNSFLKQHGKGKFRMLSLSKLKELKVPVPKKEIQEKLIEQITQLEQEINRLKQRKEQLKIEKKQVLERYL